MLLKNGLFFERIFIFLIIITSTYSVLTIFFNFGYLNVNILFELFFFALFLFSFGLIRGNLWIAIFFLLYIFINLALYLYSGSGDIRDFLIVNKFIIYTLCVSLVLPKSLFSREFIQSFFQLLIFFFLVKYLASRIIGIERPSLFYESNFEVFFLTVIFSLNFLLQKHKSIFNTIIYIFIILLSGSKSGLFICFVTILYHYVLSYDEEIDIRSVIYKFFLSIPIFSLAYFIQDRFSSMDISKVDRFVFLSLYIDELKSWSLVNYLFGTYPITPLSRDTCSTLSYYESLFSQSGKFECFSVVLHSFILRVTFDHGYIIFAFFLISLFFILINSGLKREYALFLIVIMVLNGISVSSFNSVYIAISFLIVILTNKDGIINSMED
ncbi:hypothetical protein ACI7Y0_001781 [Vibrio cholerae]